MIKACDVIDLIIEILRGSKSIKEAKACLTDGVTENIEIQVPIFQRKWLRCFDLRTAGNSYFRDAPVQTDRVEIEALQAEHEQTLKNIVRYEDILNNYDSMAQVIIEDLDVIKKAYARKRRTVVENAERSSV